VAIVEPITFVRSGNATQITVVSDLVGTVFYNWYIDGDYITTTTAPTYSIFLEIGDQVTVSITDTTDPNFDPIANAPEGYSPRRSIYWLRSTDSDVAKYKVQQKKDAGAFDTIAEIVDVSGKWEYDLLSPRLDDLADYTWRIIPIDVAGNEGTTTDIGPVTVVRTPDAPDFTNTYNSGPTTVTFTAAA